MMVRREEMQKEVKKKLKRLVLEEVTYLKKKVTEMWFILGGVIAELVARVFGNLFAMITFGLVVVSFVLDVWDLYDLEGEISELWKMLYEEDYNHDKGGDEKCR